MFKTGMLFCAMSLAATGSLHADEVIHADKMTKAQLQQALRSAPDTAVIEYQGQNKTKAQLRSAWQAMFKSVDPTKAKQLAAEHRAEFQAAAKALQDQQDQAVAKQNAEVTKEFRDLTSP
jgi:DNA-binding transcriptional regulator GbsR (MarR family)